MKNKILEIEKNNKRSKQYKCFEIRTSDIIMFLKSKIKKTKRARKIKNEMKI